MPRHHLGGRNKVRSSIAYHCCVCVLASHNVVASPTKQKAPKREAKGKRGWCEGQVRPSETDTGGGAVPCWEGRGGQRLAEEGCSGSEFV